MADVATVAIYTDAQLAVQTMRQTLQPVKDLLVADPLVQDALTKLGLALDNAQHVLTLAMPQVPPEPVGPPETEPVPPEERG